MPPSEALSREQYEARRFTLLDKKEAAVLKVVLAKRKQVIAELEKIVLYPAFSISPEAAAKEWGNGEVPKEISSVLQFFAELKSISKTVESAERLFRPDETMWKDELPQSPGATTKKTGGRRNEELVKISEAHNPGILDNDSARLQTILCDIEHPQTIDLTEQELSRLFRPMFQADKKKDMGVSLTLEQFLSRRILTASNAGPNKQMRTFIVKSPQRLAMTPVSMQYLAVDEEMEGDRYSIAIPGDDEWMDQCTIWVPKDLAPLWKSLFDEETQNWISGNPQDCESREGGSMMIPMIRAEGKLLHITHPQVGAITPKTELLEEPWFRENMLSVE